MKDPAVLLISKDVTLLGTVEGLVREVGHLGIVVVGGLDEAYAYEGWDRVAMVLIHHRHGESPNGVARLFRMLAAAKRPVATVILGVGLDESAESDLLRRGAADCLVHPFDFDRLRYLIEVLTLRLRQPQGSRPPMHASEPSATWDESDPLIAQAHRVAAQDATILIRGEAGTGKSRLARIIHDVSQRQKGPFVTLRCATLTTRGFEEDLFGPAGEPVPSAVGGKLAEARDGTLLLDDVDALSPPAQVALLRWIEEGSWESNGRGRGRPGRPRIVATTRAPLGDEVAVGRFRSDLFFRLNVIGLELPPLRRRRAEIVSLAHDLAAELAGRSVTLSLEVIGALESYTWPGNIRELREALESTLAAGPGSVVDREHLPDAVRASLAVVATPWEPTGGPDATSTLAQTKRDAEFIRITQALQKNGNNRLRTAGELGISRMTLYKKLYKYKIIEPSGGGRRRMPIRSHGLRHPGERRPRGPVVAEAGAGIGRSDGGGPRPDDSAGRDRQPHAHREIGTRFALNRHRLRNPGGSPQGPTYLQGEVDDVEYEQAAA